MRLHKISQYEIFTVTHICTNFSDLLFNKEDIVYCIPKVNGHLIVLTNSFNNHKCVFRIIEKVILNGYEAFTMIVSKTVDEPEYDIDLENQHIESYFLSKHSINR